MLIDRPRRWCLAILEVTWLLAPQSIRGEALAERRSHLHESFRAGVSGRHELASTLAGVHHDLRSAVEHRCEHNHLSLASAVFLDADLSLFTAGLLIALFAPSVWIHVGVIGSIGRTTFAGAAIVLLGGSVARPVRAHRARRRLRNHG